MTAHLPRYRARLVHLTAVWAYGVSQPVLSIIDGNPELLLSRGLTRYEVALFAIAVAVIPPALAVGYAALAGRISPWVGDVLYLVFLGAGLVPVAARLVKPIDTAMLVAALLVGATATGAVVVYARWRPARLFLGYSIIVPLAGFVWFVNGLPSLTEDAEAAQVRVASPAPVVFLLLDEFPASSLMTRRGEIDAVRYPNFARLAADATWYPNATTVHEWTSDAVPAILTGRLSRSSTLATVENYPENLFTLLGGAYSLRVHEAYATRMCPNELCPRQETSSVRGGYELFVDSLRLLVTRNLPRSLSEEIVKVDYTIELQDEADASLREFEALLGEISRDRSDDTLYFNHLLLPHAPWKFLPSGAEYDFKGLDGWLPNEHWGDDPWPVLQGYQRHLLQLAYTDRMLGRLLDRLERRGIYDRAVLVLAADHGVSFRPGEGRRPVTGGNLADIANVPLLVKYPEQRLGRVDRRAAKTIDILPTIADVLGLHLPWETDGVSLRAAPVERDVLVDQRGGKVTSASLEAMIRDRASTLDHKAAAFGERRASLYRIGTNRWLLGRDVAEFRDRSTTVEVRIENEAELRNVRRASGFIPARISGHVASGLLAPGTELAVAVNGRVRGLTTWFSDENGVQRFRTLVPEASFRGGQNGVEVFLVRGATAPSRLVLVGSTG
jgi:Sulfatase